MNKRGIGWIYVVVIILIVIVSSALVWVVVSEKIKRGNIDDEQINENESETLFEESNNTSLDLQENESNAENNASLNQSQENEEIDNSVPNPSGEINWIDKEEISGGYYCDNNTTPKHGIRLYTYRTIEGNRTLSEDYIESDEIDDICKYYDEDFKAAGINYYIEWKWTPVEGIDGYKIYQYYNTENITRDYDYFVLVQPNAEKLLDTGLNLWKIES